MRVIKVKSYEDMCRKAANLVANQVIVKPNSVLGLATGSTPIGMYGELVKLYKEGEVDLSLVKTFNLDEYRGLDKNNSQSYSCYMDNNLFKHINVNEDNINIPDGTAQDLERECKKYEEKIKEAGGIDLQILGIGRNGHIGFNEPNIKFESRTHIVKLDKDTIEANSRFFDSLDEVPTEAISMGIKTIMNSKMIILLANGAQKAEVIYETVNGDITPEIPATVLQLHPNVIIIVDEAAGAKL